MAIDSIKSFVDNSVEKGKFQTGFFRKTTGSNTVLAGDWIDFSMQTGIPSANFYASNPLESALLSSFKGIQLGGNVSPDKKYLIGSTIMGFNTNIQVMDYLLYYPFIDGDSTDDQILVNSTTLSRYQDGKGVQAMLVAQGSYTGGAQYTINYTNQDGVSGRISKMSTTNLNGSPSYIMSSGIGNQSGWSIPLEQGDYGVRSVESIKFESGNGGIACIVLVKPYGITSLRETIGVSEKNFLLDQGMSAPIIEDDAYINFIGCSSLATGTRTYYGNFKSIWG